LKKPTAAACRQRGTTQRTSFSGCHRPGSQERKLVLVETEHFDSMTGGGVTGTVQGTGPGRQRRFLEWYAYFPLQKILQTILTLIC